MRRRTFLCAAPTRICRSLLGQDMRLESIDFDDRFAVRADDRRAAVMLDQGMMQGLLDRDQVSFTQAGDEMRTFVKRQSKTQVEPVELELLFKFGDGFVSRIPTLLRTEYAATGAPTVPA